MCPRVLPFAALPLVALLLGGCREPETVLLVRVSGESPRPLRQLDVSVTVGAATRNLLVPERASSLDLPASFTVEIERDRVGAVALVVIGVDEEGRRALQGRAALASLEPGVTNEIQVVLGPIMVFAPERPRARVPRSA